METVVAVVHGTSDGTASIVDQNINPAQFLVDLLDHGVTLLGVGQVGGPGPDTSVLLSDDPGNLGQ